MKHETKATLQAPRWCGKCHRATPHRVYDGQVSTTCIPCQEKAEAERETRAQEHQRQMTFAVESAVETRAYEAKRELMKRHKAEVEVPCTCSAWPFPHIHSDGEARMARIAFANRRPSPARVEVEA